MRELIKSDFRRVFKDKLILILCIIGAAFALVTTLMYRGLFALVDDDSLGDMMSDMVTAKSQFFAAFSLGNNFGLIVPVLLAIVLCKDFSYGTVRNKIIGGHTRKNIFLSLFIVCAVSMFAVIFLHALLTLFVSLIFFDFQSTPFELNDALYFCLSLMLEVFVYIFAAALLSYMCASFKNVGVVIVIYVALSFAMTLISGMISGVLSVLEMKSYSSITEDILNFIQRINLFYSYAYIGTGSKYSLSDILYIVLPSIIGTCGILSLGIVRFNKKDLK